MTEIQFYEDLLNLADIKIISLEKHPTKLVFHCRYTKSRSICPDCLEPTEKINQTVVHKYRDLQISNREVWLHISVPQFYCSICNRYFIKNPEWVAPGKSYTKRQAKWIFEMSKQQAFTQVGALTNMSHKTVERIFYDMATIEIDLPSRYKNIRKLGIDELSHKKGKKDYVCVLTDLERGTQLDVLPNRKKATLIAHFQSLGEEFCNQIEVVSCDIWRTYITVATECFPNCEVVIDRFHVVKALNVVLDTQRKHLRREFKEEGCFKKIKWKLFKRSEKCSNQDYTLLQKAFDKSWLLGELYQMRITFNSMFDVAPNKKALSESLEFWIEHAIELNYEPLNQFIKTLKNWKGQIAAFASEHISNAVTEGLNNYLRYFKRISFGLPNFENMRMRILMASS